MRCMTRAHIVLRVPRTTSRTFASSAVTRAAWNSGPAPPRLPKEEQEMFEKLQQQSTGAFSTPRQLDEASILKDDAAQELLEASQPAQRSSEADRMLEQLRERARVVANGKGEELHPNVRRGAAPEFQGDTNPQTGEVGGPKNDPLRWRGDWSYNGRVTDF